ncbi:acyltransferase family protein [Streptomyces asoensis]|uniref:acyltransferase family protein n=1 Tax=Streptomyces asoensis TaxID=249586 RepID=UPI00340BCFEE
MSRDRYVDFLRAWAILLVVLGHWLITALVRHPDGTITAPELLATLPWTQWLTLGFQIMPLFFLAGGHAAAGSWSRARAAGGTAAGWVGKRAVRLLLPTAAYSGLVLLAVGVCAALGVDPATLALVGWAMAMQFWFLPVYLLISALTPALYALHERWGIRVPVAMGAAGFGVGTLVAVGDASSRGAAVEAVGALNYLLVWGVVHQLGFCWRDGLLGGKGRRGGGARQGGGGLYGGSGRRSDAGRQGGGPTAWRAYGGAAALAVGGLAGFALLVGPGPFPVSLILVTGQEPGNTDPPSAALLAWSLAQVGVALLVAPAVRRVLERAGVRRAVRVLGAGSMTLYLWHMLPVLIVAAAFYLTGLAPQPRYGSPGWWALRGPWLLVLAAVLAAVVRALRPLERALVSLDARVRPGPRLRGAAAWRVWAGLGVSGSALTWFAGHGFAYGGTFPAWPAAALAAGTLCAALPYGRDEVRDVHSREGAADGPAGSAAGGAAGPDTPSGRAA